MPTDKRPRIQLVTPLQSRFGGITGDSKLINGIAEQLEDGSYRVLGRQGISQFATGSALAGGYSYSYPVGLFIGSSTVSNALSAKPFIYIVGNNGTTYHLFVAAGISAGNFAPIDSTFAVPIANPNSGFNSIISCSQDASSRVVANFGQGATNVIVSDFNANPISNPAIATSVGLTDGIVSLDNTLYVMDYNSNVFGSNPGDGTTWSSLNLARANAESGNGVFLAKHRDFAVAFKTFSTEFLYDAGNPTGSPLSVLTNSTLLWGCVSSRSVQQIGDRVFWLAQLRGSPPFVAMLDGMQPRKISTPGIDKLLGDVGNFGSGNSFSFVDSFGHSYYGLSYSGSSLVYDITAGLWYQWAADAGTLYQYKTFITDGSSNILMQSTINANANIVYQQDEDTALDNGLPIQVDIYTANHDFETRRRKALERMDFIADQQGGTLQSRFSEDDFKTFSYFRSVDLNQQRPNLTKNGTYKRRAWNFRYTAPVRLRLQAVELTQELGE